MRFHRTGLGGTFVRRTWVQYTDSHLICYTDGLVNTTNPDLTKCDTRNNAPLLIGIRHRDDRPKNNAFKGAVDDLRIYNRALSDAEIQQLYKE